MVHRPLPFRLSFLVLPLVFFSLFGCATVRDLIQPPEVGFEEARIEDISFTNLDTAFTFRITNPNPVGLKIDRLDYNLELDGRPFLEGIIDSGIPLRADSSGTAEVPVSISLLDAYDTITQVFESDYLPYRISGSMSIGIFTVPFEHQGRLPVPKPPKVRLQKVMVDRITPLGADMTFRFLLENDNPFTIDVAGLTYSIALGGIDFAGGTSRSLPNAKAENSAVFELPLQADFVRLGASAYQLLSGNDSSYRLNGSLELDTGALGRLSIPLEQEGRVPIN